MIGLTWQSVAPCVMARLSITIGTRYQKRYCPRFDLRTGTIVQFAASLAVVLPLAIFFEDMSPSLSTVQWTWAFIGAWA